MSLGIYTVNGEHIAAYSDADALHWWIGGQERFGWDEDIDDSGPEIERWPDDKPFSFWVEVDTTALKETCGDSVTRALVRYELLPEKFLEIWKGWPNQHDPPTNITTHYLTAQPSRMFIKMDGLP